MPAVHYQIDDPPAELRPERVFVGRMSYAEYRRLAESFDERFEYVDGVVYSLSTGSRRHAVITANVFSRLVAAAEAAGCSALSMSLSVRTPRRNEYVPDVLVECAPDSPDEEEDQDHATDRPCVIVEVLSPSTTNVDLSEKRPAYQTIPTLGAYLVVESEWRAVHHHWRDAAGDWQEALIVGEGTIPLPCPAGATLTLSAIYRRLRVPDTPPAPRIPRLRRVREPEPV